MVDHDRMAEFERKLEKVLNTQRRQEEKQSQISRDIRQLQDLVETSSRQFDDKIQYIILRLSLRERLRGLSARASNKIRALCRFPTARKSERKPLTTPALCSFPTSNHPDLAIKKNGIESLPFEISVVMNWECNYHCSYCFTNKPFDPREARSHTASEWEDVLLAIHRKYGACELLFTGGEPLVYPEAVDLIIHATQYHRVSLGTNLWIDKGALRRLASESDPENLFVCSSFHPEHTSIEPFLGKCLFLQEHGIKNWSFAVAYPRYLHEMPEVKRRFEEKGLGIGFLPYKGFYMERHFPDEYSEEELTILRGLDGWHRHAEHSRNSKKIEMPRTKGILCYAGVKYLYIDPWGDIQRCMFVDRVIGNVFEGEFSFSASLSPCPLDTCNDEVYWKYHLR